MLKKKEESNKYAEAIARCERKGFTLIFKSKGIMDVVNKNNNHLVYLAEAHTISEILHWLDKIDNNSLI